MFAKLMHYPTGCPEIVIFFPFSLNKMCWDYKKLAEDRWREKLDMMSGFVHMLELQQHRVANRSKHTFAVDEWHW